MSLRIAAVHEEPVTKELRDMPIVALDNVGTHPLICTDHVTPVFWVELAGESSGVHQITEHHRELPSFRIGRRRGSNGRCDRRGGLTRGSRLWCWLGGLSDAFLDAFRCASPHETSALVIAHWVHVKEFILQIVEVVVIEVEASFQRTVGYPSLAFEQCEYLGEDFIEGHGHPSRCQYGVQKTV
jgi:hypothetical protein